MGSNEKKTSTRRRMGAGKRALAVAAAAIVSVTGALPLAMQEAEALDNDLALTPPMGWNSWNQTRCTEGKNGGTGLTEAKVMAAADAMATNGMKEAGYEYVVVDDCFQGGRDDDGKLFSNPETFPSGMEALGDYIHSKGLKFGIYGVPGSETCANYWDDYPIKELGSFGYEQTDAETFEEWGVDYLKYDWCRADVTEGLEKIPAFNKMRDELAKLDRDIVYAISEYGDDNPWEWGAETANLWRTTHDINSNWNSVATIINGQADLWQYSKPGAWNDPDMLQVGNGAFKDDETANRAHVGMWAMLAAPLFVGTSIPDLSDELVDTLTNPDLVAIDQDPLGKQAKRLSNDAGAQVWARPLQDGRTAVALFNSTGSAKTISTSVSAVGGSGIQTVRSVWEQQNVMNTAGALSASVPARGTVIYILTPGQDPSLPTAPELRGSASIAAGATQDVTFTVANVGGTEMTDVSVTFGTAAGVTLPTDAQEVGTIAGESTKDLSISVAVAADAQGTIAVPATITYNGDMSVTTSITISVPLADKAYVSDLTWLASSNGWGPVERDQAVGEEAEGDGPPLTLGGTVYDKGLGFNVPGMVRVALDNQCTALRATVGMDDDVIGRAATDGVTPRSTFEVVGDGTELYNFSFDMARDDPQEIDVDVTDVDVLELRSNAVGTGNTATWHGWADWADAHLVCGATTEPTPDPTVTVTSTATAAPTVTVTETATATTTATATSTATATETSTATATATATTTTTATTTETATASETATATSTQTATVTETVTVTPTATASTKPSVSTTFAPPTTKPVDGITLYTTPGYHNVNGRKWHTTCEPYSQTIRCRTEIWSTSVEYTGGTFVQDTGWHFNNLTYLPQMKRAQWGTNPLASTGSFVSGGRQWRTECDTPATGGNACRSYIWTSLVHSSKQSNGSYRYWTDENWVFNNIVKFA